MMRLAKINTAFDLMHESKSIRSVAIYCGGLPFLQRRR
jgi:Zn-dependent alcohol dehydrogenase